MNSFSVFERLFSDTDKNIIVHVWSIWSNTVIDHKPLCWPWLFFLIFSVFFLLFFKKVLSDNGSKCSLHALRIQNTQFDMHLIRKQVNYDHSELFSLDSWLRIHAAGSHQHCAWNVFSSYFLAIFSTEMQKNGWKKKFLNEKKKKLIK